MAEFYGVDFSKVKLPALMLAKGNNASVEFFEKIDGIKEDDLAIWVFDNVFSDLAGK